MSISNPQRVLEALERLVDGDPRRELQRRELRVASGIDEGAFTPVFQWMSGGPGAPRYDRRLYAILTPVAGRGDGWRRLSGRGIELLGLDADGADEQSLPLIDLAVVGRVLQSIDGRRFDTSDAVRLLRKREPELIVEIERRYGPGGRGAGQHYSAYSHIARSLSRYARRGSAAFGPQLVFDRYVHSPAEWGSHVIAMWICGSDDEPVQLESDLQSDLEDIERLRDISTTERTQLINARIGQGEFRRALLGRWQRCPVTGCEDSRLLVASHIKRWCDSNGNERLDPFNGLLLSPNADRLFDQYLISFDDDGQMLWSPQVSEAMLRCLGIPAKVRLKLDPRHHSYLRWHRERIPGVEES